MKNIAADPAQAATLAMLRKNLTDWESSTNDQGRTPETPARYDADMAVYVGEGGGKNEAKQQELRANIELNRKWAKEGK